MSKQQKKQGAAAFEEYYSAQYGERWNVLRESLFTEPQYVGISRSPESEPYYLDAASAFAACALPLSDAEELLDMCAAPGGKTLILASRMDANAHLTANERSRERFQRLKKVVAEFLPETVSERITTTCFDGSTMCTYGQQKYERILLDAPCSSERHVIQDEKYLSLWTRARVKTVSMTQWSLLSSAVLLLKPEGYILYSTCALTSEENDDVIKKALKKYKELEVREVDVDELKETVALMFPGQKQLPGVEKTEFGYHILPDRQHGAGPIFFSLLFKKY